MTLRGRVRALVPQPHARGDRRRHARGAAALRRRRLPREHRPSSLGPYLLGWSVAVVDQHGHAPSWCCRTIDARDCAWRSRDAFEAAAARGRGGVAAPGCVRDPALRRLRRGGRAARRAVRRRSPFAPPGSPRRDQAITLLVDHVNSLRLLLEDPQHTGASDGTISIPGRDDLVQAIIAGLRGSRRSSARPTPSAHGRRHRRRAHPADGRHGALGARPLRRPAMTLSRWPTRSVPTT